MTGKHGTVCSKHILGVRMLIQETKIARADAPRTNDFAIG
jgi:hypothetical protein